MGVTPTIMVGMKINMLKWYGHMLRMWDNRRPEGRKSRGIPEMRWERGVKKT
jgi:hypothetical protein